MVTFSNEQPQVDRGVRGRRAELVVGWHGRKFLRSLRFDELSFYDQVMDHLFGKEQQNPGYVETFDEEGLMTSINGWLEGLFLQHEGFNVQLIASLMLSEFEHWSRHRPRHPEKDSH